MGSAVSGRIITFYSYKGGTGRSMAVANIGWILASNGERVLVIDWDLDAPGLHRFFCPFLADEDLTSSEGVIDFVIDFAAASSGSQSSDTRRTIPNPSLVRFAASLEWDYFPPPGTLDFIPAGRQDGGYSVRVNSFDWRRFYAAGGGTFLEAAKHQLREEYDYILVDSRTGVSDTSGICTVQLPDDLVVCFTLNRQSIEGASAVAESAYNQRIRPDGRPGLRVWPVPMRVDLAEQEKLQAARLSARERFGNFPAHLSPEDRDKYWGEIEVLYYPFYSYEEVLAVFADRPGHAKTLLASMETIAGYLANRRGLTTGPIPEHELERVTGRSRTSATRLNCDVSAAPSLVRTEGLCEQVGDIALEITGDVLPGGRSWSTQFNVQVFLNTNITNRLVESGQTDIALLKIDDTAGASEPKIVARGKLVLSTGIAFPGVQILSLAPGRADRFLVRGIRANANAIPASSGGPGAVQALVSLTATTLIETNNPQLTVALAQPGLRSVRLEPSPPKLAVRSGISAGVLSGNADVPAIQELVLMENHVRAFKCRGEESTAADTPGPGTCFFARFTGVPAGVRIFVTATDLLSSPTGVHEPKCANAILRSCGPFAEAQADANRKPPEISVVAGGLALSEVPIAEHTGSAVWEWVAERATTPREQLATVRFGIVIAARPGEPELGTGYVAAGFAPISTNVAASATEPIPRFADTSSAMRLFTVVDE